MSKTKSKNRCFITPSYKDQRYLEAKKYTMIFMKCTKDILNLNCY